MTVSMYACVFSLLVILIQLIDRHLAAGLALETHKCVGSNGHEERQCDMDPLLRGMPGMAPAVESCRGGQNPNRECQIKASRHGTDEVCR